MYSRSSHVMDDILCAAALAQRCSLRPSPVCAHGKKKKTPQDAALLTGLKTEEERECHSPGGKSASDMKTIASRAAPQSPPPSSAPAAPLHLGLAAALRACARGREGYVIQ